MRFTRHPEEYLEDSNDRYFRKVALSLALQVRIATALLRRQPIIRGILLLRELASNYTRYFDNEESVLLIHICIVARFLRYRKNEIFFLNEDLRAQREIISVIFERSHFKI